MPRVYDKARDINKDCATVASNEVPVTFNQVDSLTCEIQKYKEIVAELKSELLDLYRQVNSRGY